MGNHVAAEYQVVVVRYVGELAILALLYDGDALHGLADLFWVLSLGNVSPSMADAIPQGDYV